MPPPPRAVSGFVDYSEAQNAALSAWLQVIRETYQLWGFSCLFPRPLELREVLLSQGGIQKQIFGISRLNPSIETDLALPFDRTLPLANWIALKGGEVTFPYKRYDISYSFRGERAKRGRFQGFFQADVDILGLEELDLNADVESIGAVCAALSRLGISQVSLALSHIGVAKRLLADFGVTPANVAATLAILDELERDGRTRTGEELVQRSLLAADQVDRLMNTFAFRGSPAEFNRLFSSVTVTQCQEWRDLLFVWDALLALGIPKENLQFCPAIVRGLNYYTGTVFETTLVGLEEIGSIASGGRYDNLTASLGRNNIPGVGGSIGVTRLFDAACRANLVDLKRRTEAQTLVGFRTPELRSCAQHLAQAVRAGCISCDLYSGTGDISKQLTYANRKGFKAALLVMDTASFVVRDLATRTQVEVMNTAEALAHLTHRV